MSSKITNISQLINPKYNKLLINEYFTECTEDPSLYKCSFLNDMKVKIRFSHHKYFLAMFNDLHNIMCRLRRIWMRSRWGTTLEYISISRRMINEPYDLLMSDKKTSRQKFYVAISRIDFDKMKHCFLKPRRGISEEDAAQFEKDKRLYNEYVDVLKPIKIALNKYFDTVIKQ